MKKFLIKVKNNYFVLGIIFLLLCSILSQEACIKTSEMKKIDKSEKVIQEVKVIKIIIDEKTEAEGCVKILKLYPINTEEHKKGRELYIEAQAAFNGWIDQFIFDLRYSKDLKESEEYKTTLENAAEKSVQFMNYVKDLDPLRIEIERRGLSFQAPSGIAEFVIKLLNLGLEIRENYKKSYEEKKGKIIKDLENLKWKNFDEI